MVDVADIPDFPGRPGQRPSPDAATDVEPVQVALVTAPLDRDYRNVALNAAAVDAFIQAELDADRGRIIQVERWSPWSSLQVQLGYGAAAQYNYARVTLAGRSWYGFLSAEYLNLTDTLYAVDADEWTSYAPALGYSMVERGHIAVAASQNDTYGDLYLTTPEPIEAPPVDGILGAGILGSTPGDWTVVAISANDLRGNAGNKFFQQHTNALQIAGAASLASSATIDSASHVQIEIPDASYPWTEGTLNHDDGGGTLIDTISPGHPVTNPGGTFSSGWEWHVTNASGHGGVDLAYNFQTFTAPGSGVVDHFDVAGVGMIVRLTLDVPAVRVLPQESSGFDAEGPIVAIWFEHCSAAVDGPANQGDVIGTSGDGYGQYPPHLHVHGLTDHGNVAGTKNRSQFFDFIGGAPTPIGPDVLVPVVAESPTSTIDGVSAGGGAYLFTPAGFAEYMTIMQGAPWIVSGISDVRLVPSWAIGSGGDASFNPVLPTRDPGSDLWDAAAAIPQFVGELTTTTASGSVLDGWRETVLGLFGAGIYRKLLTAPFTEILLSSGDGFQAFRPDQWRTPGVGYRVATGAAHGDPSIRLLPQGYTEQGDQLGLDTPVGGRAGKVHSGYGIAASNPASSDMTPYLAAYSSHTTWAANGLNKQLAIELALEKIQLDAGVQGIQTVLGGIGTAGSAVAAGGSGGAVGAAASAILPSLGTLATAGVTASNTITMLDISQDGSFDIGALLLGMSGVSTVAAFGAWFQSLSSVSGVGTPEALVSGWRAIVGQGFKAVISVPSADRIRALISEWTRYGYMIGRAFIPPRLDVMSHWSYWQLSESTILGGLPQTSRDSIARAFERGVTVWNEVAEIGTIQDNQPIDGVTY